MRNRDVDSDNEDIIVRSLKQPTCSNITIDNNEIHYTIEKELGIELVGDVKVKIEANEEEDPWDEITDDMDSISSKEEEIDDVVTEDFIQENTI